MAYLLAIAASLTLTLTSAATSPDDPFGDSDCRYWTETKRHPDSGELQCRMRWVCTDGSGGSTYTDKSACIVRA